MQGTYNEPPGKKIVVLGSLNIDLVQPVSRIPEAGETIRGTDLHIFVGGKGANQACAAALLGGQVQMAGMVGNDVFGGRLLRELQGAGVDTSMVQTAESASGSAIIFVLPNGENRIVISPGANAAVSGAIVAASRRVSRARRFPVMPTRDSYGVRGGSDADSSWERCRHYA